MMRQYEILFVLDPELPETRRKEVTEGIQRIIGDMEGQVTQLQEWGVRELAYRIQKHRRGYYILVEYQGPPRLLAELERSLKLNDAVLRFISVRKEEVTKTQHARGRDRPSDAVDR